MPIKIGKWIRGWKLGAFFKKLFGGITKEAKKLLPVVIDVTNVVKEVINSPVPDILVGFSKAEWDDNLLARVREWFPKFIVKLDIANVTANIEDPLERANAILALFKFSDEEMQDDFYHQLSYRLLEFLSDGNLTRSEVIVLAQMYYDHKYVNADDDDSD